MHIQSPIRISAAAGHAGPNWSLLVSVASSGATVGFPRVFRRDKQRSIVDYDFILTFMSGQCKVSNSVKTIALCHSRKNGSTATCGSEPLRAANFDDMGRQGFVDAPVRQSICLQ